LAESNTSDRVVEVVLELNSWKN